MTDTPRSFRSLRLLIAHGVLVPMFALLAPCASAQRPCELTYKARVVGTLGTAQEKWIFEAVVAQAPTAIVSLDAALAQAKFRTRTPLDPGQLNALLLPHGVQLELTSVSNDQGTELRIGTMPVLLHTGDPMADQATYEAAMQAWTQGVEKEQPQTTSGQ